jgi:hypothetical protein
MGLAWSLCLLDDAANRDHLRVLPQKVLVFLPSHSESSVTRAVSVLGNVYSLESR